MGLLEPNVFDLGAVAGVPAKRRPPKPPRVVDQEENEFECVREADELEFGCRCERHGCVLRVEGSAEAGVGGVIKINRIYFDSPGADTGSNLS